MRNHTFSTHRLTAAGVCVVFAALMNCSPQTEPGPEADPGAGDAAAETSAPLREENAPRRDIIGTEENRYSQHGEELIIRDFFQDRRNGFFLDVGCAWPVAYSNTYYLEENLGWTGFGIDALDDHARRWRNRRPKSTFFNYIVTDHSGTVESFYKTERGDLIGTSRLTPDEGLGAKTLEFEEIQVPTITLNELLDQNGIEKIDLLSMDIEGSEPAALAGFDIERFKPELAVVEVHAEKRDIIEQYFLEHGYRRIERYEHIAPANFYFTPDETASSGQ